MTRNSNGDSYLTRRASGRTMKVSHGCVRPVFHQRGRPRFDGDTVSQDALPRTITLVNQMETNITADTQLALAA